MFHETAIQRRNTREVRIGAVKIGGVHPIAIQSMTNTHTSDWAATIDQIQRLENAGCEIARIAIPDEKSAEAIPHIKKAIRIPLVADIHFDYQLALMAIERGIDKIRINPGNIGNPDFLRAIIHAAKKKQTAIRIGVNSGSLAKHIQQKYPIPCAQALVESACEWIRFFTDEGFEQLVIAVKSSQVVETYIACQQLSELTDYPLHIGITEAGVGLDAIVKSAAGLGALLLNGIGDTLRISLTGDPIEEIKVAQSLLQSLKIRRFRPDIIACPTCGRTEVNLTELAEKVSQRLSNMTYPWVVAVMGCAVNGPGEARHADFGIAGGNGEGLVFQQGKIVAKLPEDKLVDYLIELIEKQTRGKTCSS